MKITSKHLAIVAWVAAAYEAITFVLDLIEISRLQYVYNSPFSICVCVLGILSLFMLGISMFREKNNKFTFISVGLFCLVSILLPIAEFIPLLFGSFLFVDDIINLVSPVLAPICLIVLALIKKNSSKPETIQKLWFVPAIIVLGRRLFIIFAYSVKISLLGILDIIIDIALFLALGYWLIVILKYKPKVKKEK